MPSMVFSQSEFHDACPELGQAPRGMDGSALCSTHLAPETLQRSG